MPISWQGQDSESGLRDYTVRYRQGESGPWTTWLTGATATSGQFPGEANQTYYFQVEAVDNVNNTTTAQAGPVTISAVTKYYYHGGTRVAMRQGDVVYFLHTDHLGSTSLTTDATGQKVSESRYLPYGEQRWTDGDTPTDFTFTGRRPADNPTSLKSICSYFIGSTWSCRKYFSTLRARVCYQRYQKCNRWYTQLCHWRDNS